MKLKISKSNQQRHVIWLWIYELLHSTVFTPNCWSLSTTGKNMGYKNGSTTIDEILAPETLEVFF